jgi:glycine/D-amino acid oxidase-like deaminating enzyme
MKLESLWTDTVAPFPGRSDPLPAKVDVAIVGGGFTGLSAARAFARRGATVVVLEASAIAAEASGRNGGHVNNGLAVDYPQLAARVGKDRACAWYRAYDDAVDTVERIVQAEKIDCDFERRGKLKTGGTPRSLREAGKQLRAVAARGRPGCRADPTRAHPGRSRHRRVLRRLALSQERADAHGPLRPWPR